MPEKAAIRKRIPNRTVFYRQHIKPTKPGVHHAVRLGGCKHNIGLPHPVDRQLILRIGTQKENTQRINEPSGVSQFHGQIQLYYKPTEPAETNRIGSHISRETYRDKVLSNMWTQIRQGPYIEGTLLDTNANEVVRAVLHTRLTQNRYLVRTPYSYTTIIRELVEDIPHTKRIL